jgi:hypothetical protein
LIEDKMFKKPLLFFLIFNIMYKWGLWFGCRQTITGFNLEKGWIIMKKIFAMVLMLTMLFSLCGCGGNETGSSDAQIIKTYLS